MNTIRKPEVVKAKVLKPCTVTPPAQYVPAAPSKDNPALQVPGHVKHFAAIRAKAGDVVDVCADTLRNLGKKGLLAPA